MQKGKSPPTTPTPTQTQTLPPLPVDIDFSKVKLTQFLTISYAALKSIFGFFHRGAG